MSALKVRYCVPGTGRRACGSFTYRGTQLATTGTTFTEHKGSLLANFEHRRWQSSSTSSTSTSSVSQDEVSHFSRLASSWWDPHGPSRLLHLMNPLRHDFIRSCIQPEPGKKYSYLDIGCGGGIFASSAARLPSTSSVTAIDPTPSVIQVAKTQQRNDPALAEPKLTYLNCAIEDLQKSIAPTSSDSKGEEKAEIQKYDILTTFEVLEHITSPTSFLATALPHLKPGGWIIGSTIARSPISYFTTKLIAEAPIIGVVPAGTHDWKQYINPDEIQRWFASELQAKNGAAAEFSGTRIQGVIYIPALGWKLVNGSQKYGNYFFGVQKLH